MNFDPSQFGATEASSFDPSQFGAQPYDGSQDINKSAAILGVTNNVNAIQRDASGKATPDQMNTLNQETQDLQAKSDQANSAGTIATETAKGTVKSVIGGAGKFIASAVASPIDAIRSIFGKPPVNMKLPEGGTTYQQDMAKTSGDVFTNAANGQADTNMDLTKKALSATGDVVMGGADVLGAEGLAKGAIKGGTSLVEKGVETAKNLSRNATSVASYIDSNGQKVFTRLTPDELKVFKDEVKNIPEQTKDTSQIHLDPANSKVFQGAKEMSRDEFIKGHPQASEMFNKTTPPSPQALDAASPRLTAKVAEEATTQTSKVMGKTSIVPDARTIERAKAIEPYIKGQSFSQDKELVKQGLNTEAENLKSQIKAVDHPVPKRELISSLNKTERPVLIASDKTMNTAYSKVLGKATDIIDKMDGTVSGTLDGRKAFDQFVEQQFPNLYESDAMTPMRTAIKNIRSSWNGFVESQLPKGSGFSQSLRKQNLMYEAMDNLSEKVARGAPKVQGEIGTNRIDRFAQSHPTITKGIKYTAAGAAGAVGVKEGSKLIGQ